MSMVRYMFLQQGKLPEKFEMFKGNIPPFKMKKLVKKLVKDEESGTSTEIEAEEDYEVKDYDCMEVYHKTLPGQTFGIVEYERQNTDETTTLICALVPVFKENDGLNKHRIHLKRLGIPFIEDRGIMCMRGKWR